jgi:alkaline phosphatase
MLLVLAGVGIGGYYIYQTKFKKPEPISSQETKVLGIIDEIANNPQLTNNLKQGAESINLESIKKTSQMTSKQLQELLQNSNVVKDHVSNIISEPENSPNSETNSDSNQDQSLQEKAFEYGRYIYCQEVVKDYQANH